MIARDGKGGYATKSPRERDSVHEGGKRTSHTGNDRRSGEGATKSRYRHRPGAIIEIASLKRQVHGRNHIEQIVSFVYD